MGVDDFERAEVASVDELWALFEKRHSSGESFLLVTWKAARRDRYVSRDEVLDVLIAFGWIDGRRYKLDDERTMQLMSPRKENSWAATYRERAERLIAEGRMQPAGAAAIAKAKELGTWGGIESVDRLEEPDDLLAELKATGGHEWWCGAAPSYRRNVLRWIALAKREDTRKRRVDTVVSHAARSEKVPNY